MTRPVYVLGVDGGNSKTVAAVVGSHGDVAGTGRADGSYGDLAGSARGGGSDIYVHGDRAVEVIATAAQGALAAAGVTAGDLAAAVFSLAGADWPEDIAALEAALGPRLGLPVPPIVVNDAIGGLWSATPDGEGVAIVLGTFNAVGARHRDGRVFHCGFWPDRTGGFDLGSEALKAVYREGLDLGPPTALTPRALAEFGAADPLDLLHAFKRRESPIPEWDAQRLAGAVLDCADAGDAVALAIATQAGRWLADEARVCADRVGLDLAATALVFAGGVAAHPSTVLPDAIAERLGGVVPRTSTVPPVVGALRCGLVGLGEPAEHLHSPALTAAIT